MKNVIISHTDPDGWVSAYLVLAYLNEKYPGSEVTCFSYNYGSSIDKIENKVNELIDSGEEVMIYITDVTMPDEFMHKYAKYIYHLDHHKSAIDPRPKWWDEIAEEHSTITVSGYKDINNQQAEQVAACELVWLTFFKDRPMPKVVRLTGRYDIWDHPESRETYYLYNYYNTRIPDDNSAKHNAQLRYLEPWFAELFTPEGIEKAISIGKNIDETKTVIEAAQCLKSVAICKCFDKTVAVVNVSANSLYFKEIIKRHPEIDCMMPFYFSFFKNEWKVSCFTVEGKEDEFSSLDFIENFKKVMPDIPSLGGHKNACGFTVLNKDITKFTDCFEIIVKKNNE